MSGRFQRLTARVGTFLGVDDPWVRPAPDAAQRRTDLGLGAIALLLNALGTELVRGMGGFTQLQQPGWIIHLVAAVPCLALPWRRVLPLSVAVFTQAHLFVTGVTMPGVSSHLVAQFVYVFALFSGVAWARDRRLMVLVYGGILVFMFGWLSYSFALGSGLDEVLRDLDDTPPGSGLLSPFVSYAIFAVMGNVVFFGGSIAWGQTAWRNAKHTAELARQARTIAEQSRELRHQAIVEERLRIARELHDVVAHHVSVMGVQAAAARRVLGRDPTAAAEALVAVEASSRSAVGEMRSLLGTLRVVEAVAPGAAGVDRSPEPDLTRLGELVSQANGPGFEVTLSVVEDRPGALSQVPHAVALSMYRIVQEALANVRRHSTATRASVVVRVERGMPGAGSPASPHGPTSSGRFAEVEVVDNGRPRGGTSGTGLGLLGMRERIASHQGTLDIGPRLTGGYRVRVRFPLDDETCRVSA